MEAIFVPLIVFASITLSIWCFVHYKNSEKLKIQDTIVKAIDAGQQLSPETIKALGVRTKMTDIRRSILLIFLGIAVLIFAQAVGVEDDDAVVILSGMASFPIMLGIGYYVVYRLSLNGTVK
ncbi:MAG: hypothetical protein HOH19_15115 [Kordiimonadaceae bacterium]|jgi:hypothetical protein|nr:hypothetical protein [Kordiimonadaceae bacterium]MBT6033901.1 hypothetical protein [Kordiimonadaceae bacterium]